MGGRHKTTEQSHINLLPIYLDPLIVLCTITEPIRVGVVNFLIFTTQQIVAKKTFNYKSRTINKDVLKNKSTDELAYNVYFIKKIYY